MGADFTIKQGDTSPAIKMQLLDNEGEIMPLMVGDTVKLWMGFIDEDYTHFEKEAIIVEADSATVQYNFSAGDTDDEGDFDAEWRVYTDDSRKATYPNGSYLRVIVYKTVG